MPARNKVISGFVLIWCLLFAYQTLRYNLLNPLLSLELPRIPLLFPPAGWIMFYQINPTFGTAEIHGIRSKRTTRLNPHQIFQTKTIGYDNFHRNILSEVLDEPRAPLFCDYLNWKFSDYESFLVIYRYYPDVVQKPDYFKKALAYSCS